MSSPGVQLKLQRFKTRLSWFDCEIFDAQQVKVGAIAFSKCAGDYIARVMFKGKEYDLRRPIFRLRWEMQCAVGDVDPSGGSVATAVPHPFSVRSGCELFEGDSLDGCPEFLLENYRPFDSRLWLSEKRIISKRGPTDVHIGKLQFMSRQGGVLEITPGNSMTDELQAMSCFMGMMTWRDRRMAFFTIFVVFFFAILRVVLEVGFRTIWRNK